MPVVFKKPKQSQKTRNVDIQIVIDVMRCAHSDQFEQIYILSGDGDYLPLVRELGRVDELFDDNPCGHQMNERQKGLAQFLIPCGNAAKLFEVVEEPFHLLA